MRHNKKYKKLGLKRGPRASFLKILANNLIEREKITTTETRAKELRRVVERFISYGKRRDLAGFRMLLQKLPKRAAQKVYYDISPRYLERKGGYTRVLKVAKRRVRDGSKMAIIEFV